MTNLENNRSNSGQIAPAPPATPTPSNPTPNTAKKDYDSGRRNPYRDDEDSNSPGGFNTIDSD